MRLSIVTTLYRSESFVEEFYRRAVAAAEQLTDDFEIVMVNDGSPDNSLALAVDLHRADPRVVVVDLSRNFGHHRAIMAGLSYARGELVFLIDSDLDEDPELLLPFYDKMIGAGCDVVYGVQNKRRGSLLEVATGNLFYWLLIHLGGIDIPRNIAISRLMTRRYVRALVRHREREVVLAALLSLTGFDQLGMPISKRQRRQPTSYRLLSRLRLAIDYVTAFSSNILYLVFYTGLIISVLSFGATIYFVGQFLTTGDILAGWTSLITSIWMFGGMSILLLGLIGIYVARIFQETKRRPYVIVRELLRAASDGSAAEGHDVPERVEIAASSPFVAGDASCSPEIGEDSGSLRRSVRGASRPAGG